MNMRTKQIVSALAVAILSLNSALAQRVETALVDDNPVINCTEMPAAAITAIPKDNTVAQLQTAAANETVFQRFAVAKADHGTRLQWVTAFTACSDLGAGWRLPTQRELMLMWVLKAELEKTSGFTKFDTSYNYWCATENAANTGWYVNFTNGATVNNFGKSNSIRVRCLKEL